MNAPNQIDNTSFQMHCCKNVLDLHVTGLTTALVAVLNVCMQENIRINLWHYDRDTGEYRKQLFKGLI